MRRESKYVLGTPKELAEYIVDESFKFKNSKAISGDLKPYDFAIADELVDTDKLTLEEITASSDGWYGIKQIDTGFDYYGVELFADYYGGRCGQCGELEFDYNRNECVLIITEMITNVLNVTETCHEDTLLIAEPAEKIE